MVEGGRGGDNNFLITIFQLAKALNTSPSKILAAVEENIQFFKINYPSLYIETNIPTESPSMRGKTIAKDEHDIFT